jgi:hypothetical protein
VGCDDRVNDALPSRGYAHYLWPDHRGEAEKAHAATKPHVSKMSIHKHYVVGLRPQARKDR